MLDPDQQNNSWNEYKKKVDGLPKLKRQRRIIPWLVGGAAFAALVGNQVKSRRLIDEHSSDIETISNITDLHTNLIQESSRFFDQYRESVSAIHAWAQDVEDRLGGDTYGSRFLRDPIVRGKRANLVKTYMRWFEQQEKLLSEIDHAASRKRIPSSLKPLLNTSIWNEQAVNRLTLLECSYRLKNKSLEMTLDFLVPIIPEEIEIRRIISTDHYQLHQEDESICWVTYAGPRFMLYNRTNNCQVELDEAKTYQDTVRTQVCTEQNLSGLDALNKTDNLWLQESCTKQAPISDKRIQLIDLGGYHKVYCYPSSIEFDNETQSCPNYPFTLEGHTTFKIGNITHLGFYINRDITRHSSTRTKRSPLNTSANINETSKLVATEKLKLNISATLNDITSRMDTTVNKIKDTLKRLPSLNVTRENLDLFFDKPLDMLHDGFVYISDYLKGLGSLWSLLAGCMFILIIMPALEIIVLAFRLAKIPATLWIGSFKRLKSTIVGTATNISVFKQKRKRWDEGSKTV